MRLGGVPVTLESVGELTRLLAPIEPLAVKLRLAVDREHAVVPLTRDDRERIVEVLGDPPVGLGELRGALRHDLAVTGAQSAVSGAGEMERERGAVLRLARHDANIPDCP